MSAESGKRITRLFVGNIALGGITDVRIYEKTDSEHIYEILNPQPWGVKSRNKYYEIVIKHLTDVFVEFGNEFTLRVEYDNAAFVYIECVVCSSENIIDGSGRIVTVTKLSAARKERVQ